MPSATTNSLDFTGAVLDDHYHLTRVLGSGSFGVVYEAVDIHHPTKDHDRAIKFVSKAGRQPHQLAAVRREIALHTQASSHPNVVTLHRAYEDKNYFVFIMDLCRGGDLGDYLTANGVFTDEEMLKKTFLTIVDAVEALHQMGIYHRDLKPANILMSEDGSKVYIADFGLADNRNFSGTRCGTASYKAPELFGLGEKQISGSTSDVWALGIILLNMISGRSPWKRATSEIHNYDEFVKDPRFLLDVLPISNGLNSIIRRMLRANPLIRSQLSEARQAFADLDTCFQEASVDGAISGMPLYKMRSTMASELGLEAEDLCWAPNVTGTAFTRTTPSSSTPISSSAKSSMIVTPGDSMLVKDECDKKDLAGDRLRSLVSRLKTKFF